MAHYKDSLGNVYKFVDPLGRKRGQKHSAKRTKVSADYQMTKSDQVNSKYNRYRMRRGKPNGPGKPGNKSGKNKIR